MQKLVKYLTRKLGKKCSERTIYLLNAILNCLEAERWMHTMGFDTSRRVKTKEEVFDLLVREVANQQVLYLEFGVFRGKSMRYWSAALRNQKSYLHGFDSFEGLPEDWHIYAPKGDLSTNGNIPEIDDPRVQFFKGLFEETLPTYVLPAHESLVINLDADLYSSTIYVLNTLRKSIQPGTYLYFDGTPFIPSPETH